jgi:hypothetical protein
MKPKYWKKTLPLLVLLASAMAVPAAADPFLYVNPGATDVLVGEDFWVNVAVDAALVGLTGYDLTIDFDESVLEIIEAVEGDLPQSSGESFFFWTTGSPPENAIVINGAVLGDSVDGPGVLARLHFEALAPGISPLDFLFFELRDIENNPIPVVADGGTVSVGNPQMIYLTPSETEVPEGTDFAIDVAVNESVTDLTGYDLELTLDPTFVHFMGASEGPLPPSGGDDTYFFSTIENDSTLVIHGAVLGSWVDGPGILAHIELSAHYQGQTDLVFSFVELRDLENNVLPVNDEGAVITVIPGGSPVEATSWATIKSLFR